MLHHDQGFTVSEETPGWLELRGPGNLVVGFTVVPYGTTLMMGAVVNLGCTDYAASEAHLAAMGVPLGLLEDRGAVFLQVCCNHVGRCSCSCRALVYSAECIAADGIHV